MSLEGSTLRPDNEANTLVYGSAIPAKQIITGTIAVPSAAKGMIETLDTHSPRNASK